MLASADPWIALWRGGVNLLEEPGLAAELSGLGWYRWIPTTVVLSLLGLLVSAAGSLVLASVVSLLLLWSDSAALMRGMIRWVLVAAACLVAALHTVELFGGLLEPLWAELAAAPEEARAAVDVWLGPVDEQVSNATATSTWQVAAYSGLALVGAVFLRSPALTASDTASDR